MKRIYTYPILVVIFIITVFLFPGCNDKGTHQNQNSEYRLIGAVVSDHDQSKTLAAVDLKNNSLEAVNADITIGNQIAQFNRASFPVDSVFSVKTTSSGTYIEGSYRIVISDSTTYNDSISFTLPDTFSITSISPPSRIVQGLMPVSLQWSGSTGATGYIMAAVLRNSAYDGVGFSIYATSLSPAGTIPQDAFSMSAGPNPDTGWYYIYVYALAGAPDSTISKFLLPTPMPSVLAENIDKTDLTGRFGSIVVAKRDSVHVVIQP
jgi:hypothetical protein